MSVLAPIILSLLLQVIPVWRLVPDLKIGNADDPDQAFTGTFDITVRNGIAYSVHENEQRVRMWDTRGRLIREIGRNGNGPGEFSGPVKAGWRADTLWVFDSRQARISLFKPNGDFVRSFMAIAGGGGGSKSSANLVGRMLLNDGTLIGQPTLWAEQTSDKKPDQAAMIRFREGGEILDTIIRYEIRQSTVEVKLPNAAMYMAQPYTDSPMPILHTANNAIYLINRDFATSGGQASFRITKISLQGDTVFDRRFTYTPRPIKDAQFDKVVDDFVDQVTTSSGPRPAFMNDRVAARRAVLKAVLRPRFQAPITGAHPAADGTLWLQREDDGAEQRLWQVMDANGRFIGAVRVPRDQRIQHIDGQHVWVAAQDELDVPLVVRYRLVR